jgi:heptosyltransferase-2
VSDLPGHLVVRLGSLGDVVLTFAAGEALAAARPGRRLVYLVKEAYAPLVRAQPWVDEVVALGEDERGWRGALALRARLGRRRWEGVLDLQDSPRSRFLTAGLAPRRVPWRAERWARRRLVWSRRWPGIVRARPVRAVWRRYLDAARALGAEGERPPVARWGAAAESVAEDAWRRFGPGEEPAVALAPGAAWPTKAWPEARFLAVARHLAASGRRVLVLSTAAERRALPDLEAWADGEPRAHWCTAPLPVVAALLARARVTLTGDTGLSHLSAAVGTPVVTLFGSTSPELGFAPAGEGHRILSLGLPCQPCALHGRRRCPLGHFACLLGIAPARVLEALDAVLAREAPRAVPETATSLEAVRPVC